MTEILVIDDSQEFLFIINSLLEFHNVKVDSASNPILAIEKIQEKKYSLIILDYIMDEMDGLEVAQKVRENVDYLGVPIIFLTTKNLNSSELMLVNKMKLNYIQKPVMPSDLVKRVLDSIGRGQK
ncbi:MAG: response regulator [Bacteriovoracaceae bacterium]|jgi:DNA-binding response OmpR family regulator|nr:response regulator [Bacteriovoracaceae bacterium]